MHAAAVQGANPEAPTVVNVTGSGVVAVFDVSGNVDIGDSVSLNGITFRCSPSGANGCP
jgi:hypothetical protein